MSRSSKYHNKPLSTPHRSSPGAPAQEAVGLPEPDTLADARGTAPRMNSRSALPGVDADACGTAPRMNPRSALSGVAADARSNPPRKDPRSALPSAAADARSPRPRKNSRPVGRGRRPRGRRPHRRRSLAHAPASLPLLSPDSRDIEGEMALLRSLTNRLLSKRPIDHAQISRYLRLIIRAFSAQAKAPKELTDEQEVDALIKKVFHKEVDEGKISFYDLLPVRTARPGEKWWPWRHLLSVEKRRRYGLIDPDDRWPGEVDEYLDQIAAHEAEMAAHDAEMRRDIEAVIEGMFASDPVLSNLVDPDQQPPDPDDSPYNDNSDDDYPEEDPDPESVLGGEAARAEDLEACPEPRRRVRAGGGPHPVLPSAYGEDLDPGSVPHPSVIPAEPVTHPPTPTEAGLDPSNEDPPNPPPAPRIARGRPP